MPPTTPAVTPAPVDPNTPIQSGTGKLDAAIDQFQETVAQHGDEHGHKARKGKGKHHGKVGGAKGDTEVNAWGGTDKTRAMPAFAKTNYDNGKVEPTQTAMETAVKTSNSAGEDSRRARRIDKLNDRIEALTAKLQGGKLKPAQEKKIKALLPALRQQMNAETALAYLATMAKETGAKQSIVRTLNRASVGIVPDDVMESAGAYDPETNTIYMSQKLLKMTTKDLSGLLKRGVLDEQKGVKQEGKLKKSDAFHNLVATQALFAHEGTHAAHEKSGEAKVYNKAFEGVIKTYKSEVAAVEADTTLSSEEKSAKIAELGDTFMKAYASEFEYDEYFVQESYQRSQGEASEKFDPLTIDASGNRIDKETASANIASFMKAQGFTAEDVIGIFNADKGAKNATPGGWRPGDTKPGGWRPGGWRPGENQPGGWRPGGWRPGETQPGGWRPGGWRPGETQPGGWRPGGWRPGEVQPGGWRPGGWRPGGWRPGGWRPGFAFWEGQYAKALGVQAPAQSPTQSPAQNATQGAAQVQPKPATTTPTQSATQGAVQVPAPDAGLSLATVINTLAQAAPEASDAETTESTEDVEPKPADPAVEPEAAESA